MFLCVNLLADYTTAYTITFKNLTINLVQFVLLMYCLYFVQ